MQPLLGQPGKSEHASSSKVAAAVNHKPKHAKEDQKALEKVEKRKAQQAKEDAAVLERRQKKKEKLQQSKESEETQKNEHKQSDTVAASRERAPHARVCSSATDVATWVQTVPGIPAVAAAKYASTFVDNDVDSDTMDEMSKEDLKEIIPSAVHRAKVFAKWKKQRDLAKPH